MERIGKKKRKHKNKTGSGKKETGENRTMLLHNAEELDNGLGARSDKNLATSSLLGIVHGSKGIVEDTSLDHFGGWFA